MTEKTTQDPNVVVIGAGGAGLSTSYYLTQSGIDHVVLERGQVGNTWATERWDAFHLVNPNWAVRLPGFHYGGAACGGDDPDGYLSRDETVDYLHRYAEHIDAPIWTGVEVCSLSWQTDGRYELKLGDGRALSCAVVVVATGAFGPPRIPDFAPSITDSITQIHSAHYKNAAQLPPGGVLVVGSGQSGAQIAEDLMDAGRQVTLSVGRAGRRPRRYRGYDSSWWMRELGYFDRTLDNVDEETRQRILSGTGGAGSGHVGGGKGGHDIYLRAFCRDGMRLVGSVKGVALSLPKGARGGYWRLSRICWPIWTARTRQRSRSSAPSTNTSSGPAWTCRPTTARIHPV